jgi:hypothetical protein
VSTILYGFQGVERDSGAAAALYVATSPNTLGIFSVSMAATNSDGTPCAVWSQRKGSTGELVGARPDGWDADASLDTGAREGFLRYIAGVEHHTTTAESRGSRLPRRRAPGFLRAA